MNTTEQRTFRRRPAVMDRVSYTQESDFVIAARENYQYGEPYGMGYTEQEALQKLLSEEAAYYDE